MNTNTKYASAFRRSTAAMIDIWITTFIRAVFAQIIGSLWMNDQMLSFLDDFKTEFGTDMPKDTPEHINYIMHHPIFIQLLLFYSFILMIGAAYHSYLNSSAWNGTIGKRAMGIVLHKQNDLPITFSRAMLHYFLSIFPFVLLFYLLGYQLSKELNFYQTITASATNIFMSFLLVFWTQIQIFTKKKTTAYDMIANTIMVRGRTGAKWPWS